MIKVSGLNKYYNKGKNNELHVINNTTLELPDTGLICVLGESGSGKTTLMNTVSGLDDFESGLIDVDGIEIKKFGDKNQERVRNEKFGYIFQNYYLLQDRTVEYNLMISLDLYNISDEEKEERIDYVLKAVDMWRYKKRLVSQLSGGQQQRIAIARALAKSPKVIFADEPTGNLDEANTMRIMGILRKISKNCLVVVVTHEKSIADFFADRIIWIADGKIQDDRERSGHKSYSYVEDTNLYLGEYEKREFPDDNIKVEIYDRGEKPQLGIKLICDNGKVYISVGDAKNVEILSSESEKQVLEGKKPVVEMTDVEEMEYSLSELEYAKKPKLGIKEIKNIALSNIRAMGKRQLVLIISLLAMSVMMVLAVQDIMTVVAVKEQDVVKSDSNLVLMDISKGSLVSTSDFNKAKKTFLAALKDDETLGEKMTVIPDVVLSYVYSGFSQLENVKTDMSGFSYVPLDKLDEKDLLYGEMPKADDEIVVDKWVLENFIESSNTLSNVISNVRHFLGKTLTAPNGEEVTIVGISESEEMDVYISETEMTKITKYNTTYVTYSEYVSDYDTAYEGDALGQDEEGNFEALVSEAEFKSSYNVYAKSAFSKIYIYENQLETYNKDVEWLEQMVEMHETNSVQAWWKNEDEYQKAYDKVKSNIEKDKKELDEDFASMTEAYGCETYEECVALRSDYSGYSYSKTTKTGSTYTVVGFYSDEAAQEMNAEIVIADEAVKYLTTDIISYMGRCYMYGDAEEIEEAVLALKEYDSTKIALTFTNSYETLMEAYRAQKAGQFNSKIIVTITIFVVSMVILYFMMKANAVQRMGDLGVYRLIGISKGSILGLFAFENAVLTSYTSLVGAVLATLATYILSSIPSLGFEVNYPWYAFLLTVLFLYAANILVGIMPIRKILRLPPAQLASKYDI